MCCGELGDQIGQVDWSAFVSSPDCLWCSLGFRSDHLGSGGMSLVQQRDKMPTPPSLAALRRVFA